MLTLAIPSTPRSLTLNGMSRRLGTGYPNLGYHHGLLIMTPNPPPGPGQGGLGNSLEEAIARIETELRQAIAYVNDNVVPQVRRESISAMRSAADTLRNLADRFDRASTPPKDPRP